MQTFPELKVYYVHYLQSTVRELIVLAWEILAVPSFHRTPLKSWDNFDPDNSNNLKYTTMYYYSYLYSITSQATNDSQAMIISQTTINSHAMIITVKLLLLQSTYDYYNQAPIITAKL